MSDLTEAVRRLRGLREDVERLKAASDEAGEVRYLRNLVETAEADDLVETGPDADVVDEALTAVTVTVGPDADVLEQATAVESVVVGPTADVEEIATAQDVVDVDVSVADDGSWDVDDWNTMDWA